MLAEDDALTGCVVEAETDISAHRVYGGESPPAFGPRNSLTLLTVSEE
jgi:hypothetical protein